MNFATLSLAAASIALIAAAPAHAESKDYDLPEFEKIDISAGIKLVANVGSEQSISVESPDGDFSKLEIRVRNGALEVSREWNRLSWHNKKGDYKVTVSVPALSGFAASSGAYAQIMNVDSRDFEMDLSSGAHAEISGNCDNCELDLSSGAHLVGKELVCDSADIDVSSGGHGSLVVRESVVADASSGGHVSVYGNPTRVDIDKSSGGRIKIKTVAQASRD